MYYVCSGCQSFYEQPLGRMTEQVSDKGHVNLHLKAHAGPPVSGRCPECNFVLHVSRREEYDDPPLLTDAETTTGEQRMGQVTRLSSPF